MNRVYVHEKVEAFLKAAEDLLELDKQNRRAYHTHHRSMVDIQHEIELSEDYDDEMKLGLFSHLQEVARDRRRTKDTIFVVDAIEKLLNSGTSLSQLRTALKIAEEESTRTYSPREIKTLDFSDSAKLNESRKRINYLRNLKDGS